MKKDFAARPGLRSKRLILLVKSITIKQLTAPSIKLFETTTAIRAAVIPPMTALSPPVVSLPCSRNSDGP